jgi:phosphopantothenoylcysteine decarboxylase/phosphopantothenate--cysteine ligase
MPPITLLQDKRIVLAATGSIAIYKVVDLASKLTQAGAIVDVIMTQAAQKFVTPLAFQSVTGRSVYTSMWNTGDASLGTHIAHVGLGEGADLLAVIPATAHTMARLAQGMADDLLTVTALAARCPLLIAPAMDGAMYEHPATQANVKTLLERGAYLVAPEWGRFASGIEGLGRLPERETLMGHIRRALGSYGALQNRRIVVTAGGTREALDPVRYITNRSSGKQGYAIAQAALDMGARVTLVSSADLPAPIGAQVVAVDSAQAMHDAVFEALHDADALIMAAAVADYRPADVSEQKIKKSDGDLSITLARNPDILANVAQRRDEFPRLSVVVGFAAESENLHANAQGKLERKQLDMLIANDISAPDAGFAHDNNRVVFFRRGNQEPELLALMSKTEVGERILQEVAQLLQEKIS